MPKFSPKGAAPPVDHSLHRCDAANLRERRALSALLAGPVKREHLDKLAGVSNAPDLIMNLRREMGLQIPCKIVRDRDRDGKRCVYGVYSLSDRDLARLSKMRGEQGDPLGLRKLFERAADEALASVNLFFDCAASAPSGGVA